MNYKSSAKRNPLLIPKIEKFQENPNYIKQWTKVQKLFIGPILVYNCKHEEGCNLGGFFYKSEKTIYIYSAQFFRNVALI